MKVSDWHMDLIFPTPVWWGDTDIDRSPLKRLALKLKKEDPEGRSVSNIGGWQSHDLTSATHPELKDLEKVILEQASRCLVDYGFCLESGYLEISNFWININYLKDLNVSHFHHGSFVSGVYYIEAEESQGEILFQKNNAEAFIVCSSAGPFVKRTNLSKDEQAYIVKPGRIIMFPSSLVHRVAGNQTDRPRISISWNVRYKEYS